MFAEEETTNVRPLRTSRPLPGFHGGSGGHWRRALSSSQLAALGGLANVLVTSYEAGSAVPTLSRTTAKSQDKTGQDADADVGVSQDESKVEASVERFERAQLHQARVEP